MSVSVSEFPLYIRTPVRGAQGAQLVKRLTLDFSSDHDPGLVRWSPVPGSGLAARSLLGILIFSLSVSLCPSRSPLKINKLRKKENV